MGASVFPCSFEARLVATRRGPRLDLPASVPGSWSTFAGGRKSRRATVVKFYLGLAELESAAGKIVLLNRREMGDGKVWGRARNDLARIQDISI